MVRINPFFCSGPSLTQNLVTPVDVPDLVWGFIGSDIDVANTAFDVQLINAETNAVLSTMNLPQGFPAITSLVQTENYPGRSSVLRVILNPRFQIGSAIQTFDGCFTDPDSTQSLDARTVVRVDPDNNIDEGKRENDNELPFLAPRRASMVRGTSELKDRTQLDVGHASATRADVGQRRWSRPCRNIKSSARHGQVAVEASPAKLERMESGINSNRGTICLESISP